MGYSVGPLFFLIYYEAVEEKTQGPKLRSH